MAIQLTTTLRNNRVAALKALSDAQGANTGKILIYTGSPPGVSQAATGTLLATLTQVTLTAPSGGQSNVTATFGYAAASGTPGYARMTSQDGTVYAEFDAAVGSGTLNFTRTIVAGRRVALATGVIADGNS